MDINKKRSRSIDSKKSENKRQKRDSYDSDDQESDDSGAEYDSSSDEDEDNGHVIDEEVDPEEILTKLSNTNIESGTIKVTICMCMNFFRFSNPRGSRYVKYFQICKS